MNYEKLKQRMQVPKKASTYARWINTQLKAIQNESNALANASPLHKNDTYKKLIEEALPLALFSKFYFKATQGVYIKHCIDSENRQEGTESYDAEVVDEKGHFAFAIKFLEVTYPHDGKAEKLESLHCLNKGSVPYRGKFINKDGTPCVVNSTAKVKNDNELIKKTIENKNSIEYLKKTALIVYFDDSSMLTTKEFEAFQDEMKSITYEKFCLIAFVGTSQKHFFVLS